MVSELKRLLELTEFHRDRYLKKMQEATIGSKEFIDAYHCWSIDKEGVECLKKEIGMQELSVVAGPPVVSPTHLRG